SVQGSIIAGPFAVQMFFVISGFYMALVLNEKYTERSPYRFYLARLLRLWPAYIVVLSAVLLYRGIQHPDVGIIEAIYFYGSGLTLIAHETLWWFKPNGDGTLQLMRELPPFSPHLSRMTYMQHM